MKKQLFTLAFLSFTFAQAQAQVHNASGGSILPNQPTTNDNVGIGINTPNEKLHVKGNGKFDKLIIDHVLPNNQNYANRDIELEKAVVFNVGSLVDNKFRTMRFLDFPSSNFNPKPWVYFSIEDRADARRFAFNAYQDGAGHFELSNSKQKTALSFYENDGFAILTLPQPDSYLSIGTDKYSDNTGTYRLSVNGKIRAEEVKVYINWADYVFYNDYNLEPLENVEKFIQVNGHLKNVPSATEVERDGINLGDITRIQQEKIEELTLYLIEQDKKIKELSNKIDLLIQK